MVKLRQSEVISGAFKFESIDVLKNPELDSTLARIIDAFASELR